MEFVALPGRPVSTSAGRLRAVASLLAGLGPAFRLIRRHRPDVVIATGGYVSTAMSLAQEIARKPVILLEGNAVPGRATRLLALGASAVCTAFKAAAARLPAGKAVLTGFPVRDTFLRDVEPATARRSFGLSPDTFTLMVVGGSQGAVFLNNTVAAISADLLAAGVQILHQMGPKNDEGPAGPAGWIRAATIEDMAAAYASADVVVSRAGASTLSEMAVKGAAAMLVPYPFAADQHQQANGEALEQEGRVVVCPQSGTPPERFTEIIIYLKNNEAKRHSLRDALRDWGRPGSAGEVADIAAQATSGSFDARTYTPGGSVAS